MPAFSVKMFTPGAARFTSSNIHMLDNYGIIMTNYGRRVYNHHKRTCDIISLASIHSVIQNSNIVELHHFFFKGLLYTWQSVCAMASFIEDKCLFPFSNISGPKGL